MRILESGFLEVVLLLGLLPGVPCFPVLFDLMMSLRSTETHNITLKNLTLFRPSPQEIIVEISSQYSTNSNVIQASIDSVNCILLAYAKFSSLTVCSLS